MAYSTYIQKHDMRAYEGFLFFWSHADALQISYKYFCDITGIPQIRVLERTDQTRGVRKLNYFASVVSKLSAFSTDIDYGKHDLIWILLYCNTERFASYLTAREQLLGLARENPNWQNSLVVEGIVQSTQYSEPQSVLEFKLGSAEKNTSQQVKSFAQILAERKQQF